MSQPEILRWDQAYNRNGDGKLPRAVVNAIRTYMNNHTLIGWVSQETLMLDTGLSESQVRRQIKANVDAGWLEVVKRGCVGKATDYRLTYPKPVMDDRFSVASDGPDTGHVRPVSDLDLNRSWMTGNQPIPCTDDRFKPVMDDTPTSPRTSPQEKFFREAPEGADSRGHEGPSMSEPASAGSGAAPLKARLREPDSDPWGSASEPATATEGATEAPEGLAGLRPPAIGGRSDDPFSEESQAAWRAQLAEAKAREKRADTYLEYVTAPRPMPWD